MPQFDLLTNRLGRSVSLFIHLVDIQLRSTVRNQQSNSIEPLYLSLNKFYLAGHSCRSSSDRRVNITHSMIFLSFIFVLIFFNNTSRILNKIFSFSDTQLHNDIIYLTGFDWFFVFLSRSFVNFNAHTYYNIHIKYNFKKPKKNKRYSLSVFIVLSFVFLSHRDNLKWTLSDSVCAYVCTHVFILPPKK